MAGAVGESIRASDERSKGRPVLIHPVVDRPFIAHAWNPLESRAMNDIDLGGYNGTAMLSGWTMFLIATGATVAAWLLWRWQRP